MLWHATAGIPLVADKGWLALEVSEIVRIGRRDRLSVVAKRTRRVLLRVLVLSTLLRAYVTHDFLAVGYRALVLVDPRVKLLELDVIGVLRLLLRARYRTLLRCLWLEVNKFLPVLALGASERLDR